MRRAMLFLRQNGSFLTGAVTLSCGAFAAQLIPVLVSPLLTRAYTDAQFGAYALFTASLGVFSQIVCLKYDMAVSIVPDGRDAAGLFFLCLLSSGAAAGLLSLLLPAAPAIARLLRAGDTGWIYFIPPSVFFAGTYAALTGHQVRMERYHEITRAAVFRAGVLAALQLLLSPLPLGGTALCAATTASYIAGSWALLAGCRKELSNLRFSAAELSRIALAHRSYPAYTTPGSLANALVYHAGNFLISAFYSPAVLGQYSLIQRILATPISVVSASFGQVFVRRLSARGGGDGFSLFCQISCLLAAVSGAGFALAGALADPMIPLIFGGAWRPAVSMLRVMLPLFAVRFVVNSVSSCAIVAGRQRATMLWQVSLLALSALPAAVHLFRPLPVLGYLSLLTALLTAGYLIFYLYCYLLLKEKRKNGAS